MLGLGLLSTGQAQIQPTDGFIYAYTNYNSDTTYGFPTAALVSDSHSGFIYSTVGAGDAPILLTNFFGPTDESYQCNTNMRAEFNLMSDSALRIESRAYGGVEYWWILRDYNYADVTSYSGWGDSTVDVPTVPAGHYTLEVYYAYSFWNGGSYALSELDIRNLSFGIEPSSYVVTDGTEFSGDLWTLTLSDDYALCVLPNDTTLGAQVQFFGQSAHAAPSEMVFQYEGHVERPGLSQTVAVYNYALSQYVVMSGGVAPTEDTRTDIVLSGHTADYIGDGGNVSSEVTWAPINDEEPAADGWLHCVDQAVWRVTP